MFITAVTSGELVQTESQLQSLESVRARISPRQMIAFLVFDFNKSSFDFCLRLILVDLQWYPDPQISLQDGSFPKKKTFDTYVNGSPEHELPSKLNIGKLLTTRMCCPTTRKI